MIGYEKGQYGRQVPPCIPAMQSQVYPSGSHRPVTLRAVSLSLCTAAGLRLGKPQACHFPASVAFGMCPIRAFSSGSAAFPVCPEAFDMGTEAGGRTPLSIARGIVVPHPDGADGGRRGDCLWGRRPASRRRQRRGMGRLRRWGLCDTAAATCLSAS